MASAEKCERFGMVLYKAPNGEILAPGLNEFAPASCILRAGRLPDYKGTWSTMSKQWGSTGAPMPKPGLGWRGERKRQLQH